MKIASAAGVIAWLLAAPASANGSDSMLLEVGAARQLGLSAGAGWKSSASDIVEVYENGFVVGLRAGQARVTRDGNAECLVTVQEDRQALVDPASLKQFPDEREFTIGHRKCFGSELNGQRASDPAEKQFTRANRVINPKPLRADRPLDWELQPGTEVYDGAGVLMGTVPAALEVGGRRRPASMFNFGASKVLGGRICVYAFSVSMIPSAEAARIIDPADLRGGAVAVSAWLPLDSVVDKETLLERAGLGKAKPRALTLEAKGWRISGGNPKMYWTEFGELSIVRQAGSGAVPSHYLRRPGGTINLVYSVPGFGLGGQGVDSFLISDGLEFYPAKGAKVFHQPTYYPPKHPQAGKVSPQTMTFLYGAVKIRGAEPVYGWIAKEALAGASE